MNRLIAEYSRAIEYTQGGYYMRFLWDLMEKSETSFAARIVSFISISFIIVSTIGMTLNTIPSVAGVDENGEATDNPKLAMLEVLNKFHSANLENFR